MVRIHTLFTDALQCNSNLKVRLDSNYNPGPSQSLDNLFTVSGLAMPCHSKQQSGLGERDPIDVLINPFYGLCCFFCTRVPVVILSIRCWTASKTAFQLSVLIEKGKRRCCPAITPQSERAASPARMDPDMCLTVRPIKTSNEAPWNRYLAH